MSHDGNDDDQPGIFSAIGREQCVQLLTEHSIGRVAWQGTEGPQIIPVTYAWFEGAVIFRTSPYGVLSELMRPTEVAFEVDEFDENQHHGWSVVVHGRTKAVAEHSELSRMWTTSGVVPWASGTRNLFIHITPHQLTGRRVAARSG
jgi:nitroimidazol reductase NimA-like FMN-containing flavoprotein (pyridoxamine 5'-phosphate oxidase superfamily)